MEELSLALSVIAILFGIVEFFRQDKTRRQLAAIEEARRTEEVAARLEAHVTAQIETEPATNRGSSKSLLVLINNGPAVAREVDFETPEPDHGDAPHLMREGMVFPVDLDPGQRYPIHAIFMYQGSPTFPVTLTWVDGRSPQTKTLTLASD
jgi:hypothetical protein